MTESATSDDVAAPPLTQEAQKAFSAIAKWCDEQREDAETTARRQFRTIWWLLGAGLVLLLTLPRIVAYIDLLDRDEVLPPVVVQEAANAKALLAANQSEMQKEVDDAQAALDRLQAELVDGEADLAASETALRTAIESPLAIWRISDIAGLKGSPVIQALIRAPDDSLIAAGSEGSNVMLLRSTDGVDWTPVRLEVRLPGSIYALMTAPDGTLFAAGRVSDRGGEKALFLRSTNGADWTPVGPEAAGERLAGQIAALIAAPDGALFAAGMEGSFDLPRVLFLRSTDGIDWTPVGPEAAGERQVGGIFALIAASDGTLIGAGWERDRGVNALLLRSTDGIDWTPVRPEAAGERLAGSISALIAAPDGMLIAAGLKGGGALLLRSTDGADWKPVELESAGEPLAGGIDALIAAPDGTLIAAGNRLGILRSAVATERPGIASALLDNGVLPPGLIVPAGTAQRLSDIVDRRPAIVVLQNQERQQQAFLTTARTSLTRQKAAAAKFQTVTANLEEALRTADLVRQASRIATRLAVIALLIFLVQIVVNRYRYLQRLAGFHQARAQAFRMLADSDPALGGALLKGVTATGLIASLSPDAIRFDKTAAPPTDNLATILPAALRRS